MRPLLTFLLRAPLFLLLGLTSLWATLALFIDGPSQPALAAALAAFYVVAVITLAWRLRPWRRAAFAVAVGFLLVLGWWLSLTPSNTRDWLEDVSRPPLTQLDGEVLTVQNVRNFTYRGGPEDDRDYTPQWETRRYDLSKLTGVELFVSNWGPVHYGHTILSWQFADAPPLAVSIETRKEKGESYSAVLGFFRQYELYFVAADERDVLGVRTNHREEHIRRYRLHATPREARALLLAYAEDMNRLAQEPRWYNALTSNCTTVIFRLVHTLRPQISPWHWQVLANGHLPRWLYDRQLLDTPLAFDALQAGNDITGRAQAAGAADDFWRRIRTP